MTETSTPVVLTQAVTRLCTVPRGRRGNLTERSMGFSASPHNPSWPCGRNGKADPKTHTELQGILNAKK